MRLAVEPGCSFNKYLLHYQTPGMWMFADHGLSAPDTPVSTVTCQPLGQAMSGLSPVPTGAPQSPSFPSVTSI